VSERILITFEGGEGTGKSTQLALLAERLESAGASVLVTREPGGTKTGEAIRALLLDPASEGILPRAELLLYEAARTQLVAEVIQPALDAGSIVLCDRFYDSTTAYQGHARGIDLDTIRELNMLATGGLRPDMTLVYELSPDEGLHRATRRQQADRLESEDAAFHERVAEGFRAIVAEESGRVFSVVATGSIDEVFERTLSRVSQLPAVAALLGNPSSGEGSR